MKRELRKRKAVGGSLRLIMGESREKWERESDELDLQQRQAAMFSNWQFVNTCSSIQAITVYRCSSSRIQVQQYNIDATVGTCSSKHICSSIQEQHRYKQQYRDLEIALYNIQVQQCNKNAAVFTCSSIEIKAIAVYRCNRTIDARAAVQRYSSTNYNTGVMYKQEWGRGGRRNKPPHYRELYIRRLGDWWRQPYSSRGASNTPATIWVTQHSLSKLN